VEFLGHVVGQGWIFPVTTKVEAIAKFPAPTPTSDDAISRNGWLLPEVLPQLLYYC